MNIPSKFTAKGSTMTDVFNSVTWSTRHSQIVASDGRVLHDAYVEFPDAWSDNAVNIVSSKYFKIVNGAQETSLKQMISRVVLAFSERGISDGYFIDDTNRIVFESELTYILLHQYASFNSPVWFNIGVPNRPQQVSACFLLDVEDSMENILRHGVDEGLVFKGGSGSGLNISNLRAKGEPLSTGGTSSGPLSFLSGWDKMAGAIKSGGTTRRAARMVIMDYDHPDVVEFIHAKVKEEHKAKVLVAQGFTDGIDGEAYDTVAYQNANHSISVTDWVMELATHAIAEPIRLTGRASPKADSIKGRIFPSELLMEAARAAWECGDPGLFFSDRVNEYNTVSVDGQIKTSNPCAEFVHLPYTSCNLSSINLIKFLTGDRTFDYNNFNHTVAIMTIAQDISIQLADFPSERIKEQTLRYRPIGIGFSNLGATLMAAGIPYDSDKGREFAASVASSMTAQAYGISYDLAQLPIGPFPAWEANKDSMLKVLEKHANASNLPSNIWQGILSRPSLAFRNSYVTNIAPVGTISFMMDNDTTGIEPEIALTRTKTLVGGGSITTTAGQVESGLRALGVGSEGIASMVSGETFMIPSEHQKVFATALGGNGMPVLKPKAHIDMVAAVQPHISGGISKTVNCPSDYTPEDIYDLFIYAWKKGCKAISVYRDQSKMSQPVNVDKSVKVDKYHWVGNGEPVQHITPTATYTYGPGESRYPTEGLDGGEIFALHPKVDETPRAIRVKMPIDVPTLRHKFRVGTMEGYIFVGEYDDGSPGELFIQGSKEGSTVNGLLDTIGLLTSYCLQHGVPLQSLVDKLTGVQFEPAGFTGNAQIPTASSLVDYIFKWLSNHYGDSDSAPIADSVKAMSAVNTSQYHDEPNITAERLCGDCGSMMIRTGTCYTCTACGNQGGCG